MRISTIIIAFLTVCTVLLGCSTGGVAYQPEAKSVSTSVTLSGNIDWQSEYVPGKIWVYCELFGPGGPGPTPLYTFYANADENGDWSTILVLEDDRNYYLYGSRSGWTVDCNWYPPDIFNSGSSGSVSGLDWLVTD